MRRHIEAIAAEMLARNLRLVLLATALSALGSGCFLDDFWEDDGTPVSQDPNAGPPDQSADPGTSDPRQPWPPAPALRNAVTTADDALARQALALMGSASVGAEGSCRACHSLGRPTLTRWSKLTREFAERCLAEPGLSDQAHVDSMLECFRRRSVVASASFKTADFGIYSVAAHLPWFSFVFEHASKGLAHVDAEQQLFVSKVGMPRAGQRFSQAEFDVLAEWFTRGTPRLYAWVPEDSGEDCTPGLDPKVAAHVDELRSTGWRARNEEVPLLMFGCGEGESGSACLGDFALAKDQSEGAQWDLVPGSQIRLLHDNSDSLSKFWSRASADGRYIGSGLLDSKGSGFSGHIWDLEQARAIRVDFSYDATFFPDNSGFLLQQGGNSSSSSAAPGRPSDGSADPGDVALICDQSVLASSPEQITGEEDECVSLSEQVGLYQQLAKSVDGGDYWVIHGSYESDDGGFEPVLANPTAAFEADSFATLTPMINQGGRFEAGTPTRLQTTRQGDPTLSPSGRLLVTRMKGKELMARVDGFDVVTAEQRLCAAHADHDAGRGRTIGGARGRRTHLPQGRKSRVLV